MNTLLFLAGEEGEMEAVIGCSDGMVHRYSLLGGPQGARHSLIRSYEAIHLEGVPVLSLYHEAGDAIGSSGNWPQLRRETNGSRGRLFAGGRNGAVVLWDTATGDLKREFWHRQNSDTRPAQVTALTGDGSRLLAGGSDGTVLEWFVDSGELLRCYREGHRREVTALCLAGGSLFSSSADGGVGRWRRLDGKLVGLFAGHSKGVTDLSLTPDGKALCTASRDMCCRRFDVESARIQFCIEASASAPARLAQVIGKSLFVGCDDGSLFVFDATSGDIEARLECFGSPMARSLLSTLESTSYQPLRIYGQGTTANEVYVASKATGTPGSVIVNRFEVPTKRLDMDELLAGIGSARKARGDWLNSIGASTS